MATPADWPTPLPPEPAPPPPPSPPALQTPRIVYVIMLLCLGAFAATCYFARSLWPDAISLICCGAKDRQQIQGAGEWWRLVSAGFLHGGPVHLLVNLYALWALGGAVERLWGRDRFVLIFLGAVVVGNLASLAATPGVSVGASGGAFGLFGAIVVFATIYRRFIRPEARRGLLINLFVVAAINIGLGIAVPYIDNAAHAGGCAMGALAALVLRPVPARDPDNLVGNVLGRALALGAGLATCWCLYQAVDYARSAGWMLLLRTQMVTRTVAKGQFSLSVPRGWAYRAPKDPIGPYVFAKDGMPSIQVFAPPAKETADVRAFTRSLIAQLTRQRGKLLAQRDIRIGDRLGVELVYALFRTARVRAVVVPASSERVFYVKFVCRLGNERRLDILFDLVLRSIETYPAPPTESQARVYWQRFTRNRRDVEACTVLATHFRLEGRTGDAEQMLRLAIATRPDHADAHDQLAYLYATAPKPFFRPREAVRHARRAVALRPDTPRYLATLAIAHEAAGDLAQALAAARRAAALAPKDATFADLVKRLSETVARKRPGEK